MTHFHTPASKVAKFLSQQHYKLLQHGLLESLVKNVFWGESRSGINDEQTHIPMRAMEVTGTQQRSLLRLISAITPRMSLAFPGLTLFAFFPLQADAE